MGLLDLWSATREREREIKGRKNWVIIVRKHETKSEKISKDVLCFCDCIVKFF
jgi:hypothetical protein